MCGKKYHVRKENYKTTVLNRQGVQRASSWTEQLHHFLTMYSPGPALFSTKVFKAESFWSVCYTPQHGEALNHDQGFETKSSSSWTWRLVNCTQSKADSWTLAQVTLTHSCLRRWLVCLERYYATNASPPSSGCRSIQEPHTQQVNKFILTRTLATSLSF